MSRANRSGLKIRMVKSVGVPVRTCVCCGSKRAKAELIRLGVNGDGNITLDEKGKKAGRGSYICRDAECIKAARKSARRARIYGRPISDSIFVELENLVGCSCRESDSG